MADPLGSPARLAGEQRVWLGNKEIFLRLAGEQRGSAIWRTPPQKSEWGRSGR